MANYYQECKAMRLYAFDEIKKNKKIDAEGLWLRCSLRFCASRKCFNDLIDSLLKADIISIDKGGIMLNGATIREEGKLSSVQ